MNPSVKLLVAVLALMAAVLAGLAARIALQPPAQATASVPATPTFPVVVTTRPVPAGQRLTLEDLRLERYPQRPAGAHDDAAKLVGQRAAVDLGANVPVLDTLTSAGLAQRVPAGERAVAVRVDEVIGIGHRVRPGDVVDLFVLLKQDTREVGFTQSRLLLPAVRVLGYGSDSVDGPAADAPAKDGQRRDVARTAIVSVPLAHVNHLLLGAASGHLAMALRHPDDRELPNAAFLALPPALALPKGAEAAADWAAAGMRLDTLSGNPQAAPRARTVPVAATAPRVRPSAAPRPTTAPTPAADRVEVLRPGRRESLPY